MYNLNKEQKLAVEYTSGPLLIVAGAGTGKTTVITEKIAYLIKNNLAKPEEILALTFTEKAAGEMQDRVDQLLDLGYSEMQISTFHAFCQKILEYHALDIGLPNQFKLLTQTDAWLLVRKNLDKFDLDYYRPLGNPTRHIHELLKHFSKCKDELITPAEYMKYSESVSLDGDNAEFANKKARKQESKKPIGQNDNVTIEQYNNITINSKRLTEIANAYHTYNQLLLDNNCLDFGDLIFYTIKLLQERPNILKLLQSKYKYILVDEFQDVNYAQYELVKLLSDANTPPTPLKGGIVTVSPLERGGSEQSEETGCVGQLTVVGDDDQSIYAFRGASVSNILRFKDDFPKAKEIVLTENYRSNQEILDLAYKSIQNNNPDRLEVKLKIDKHLKSTVNSKQSAVECKHFESSNDEVDFVINQIREICENESVVLSDFAILIRANSQAEPFINALEKVNIPYEYFASSGLYRESIILDCVNFLKAIDNYHESSAIFRLLHLPFLNFSADDLHKLTYFAKKKSISLYEALKRSAEAGVTKESKDIVDILLNLINVGMQMAKDNKPTVILLEFLEKSGYFQYLTHAEEQGEREVLRKIQQLRKFFEEVRNYEEANPQARVAGFMEHYNYILESGDEGQLYQPADTSDAVRISTIHSAKGLEFKYVFVVNLVEDRFPTRRRGEGIEMPEALIKEHLPEGDYHIQEERRLFYVACTRAKEKLFLTSAEDCGGVRRKKISRFLTELGFAPETIKQCNNVTIDTLPHCYIANNKTAPSTERKSNQYNNVTVSSDTFSYSQINSYQRCPYQYKLAHVLKIPTKGSASFSFGSSMHNTLQKFYNKIIELNSAKQESLFGVAVDSSSVSLKGGVKVPTLDELLKLYEESWISDWYDNKKQREDYFQKGKEVLKTFYTAQVGNWTIPTTLEGWFKIKVGPASTDASQGGDYFINGRIDRIDHTPEGLEIIDYKTGKAKEKIEGDDKNQLLIYQMAVQTLPEYKNLGSVNQLTFYYLEEGTKLSFIGDDKDLEKLQEKILKTISLINAGDFTATPNQFMCRHCDFRDICEYREI